MNLSRRQMIAAGAIALGARTMKAAPLVMPIGCQTYPVRDILATDSEGPLQQIRARGYGKSELCSRLTYAEYRPIAARTPAAMRKEIEGAGVGCEGCHHDFREL